MFQDSDLLCFAASSALTVVRWLRPWMQPWPQDAQELSIGIQSMPSDIEDISTHQTCCSCSAIEDSTLNIHASNVAFTEARGYSYVLGAISAISDL